MKYFSQFDDNKNNNFNLIRLSAALLVLYIHSYGLLGQLPHQKENPIAYFIYLLGNVGVDLFFLVSGFLVTRSYLARKNLKAFLWARFLRIYPGLICAVFFSVFVIGLFNTALTSREYVFNKEIYQFIGINLSLLKTAHSLPKLFEGNFYPNQVNGSLWTLAIEARLYLYVAVLGVLGILVKQKIFNIIAIGLLVIYLFFPSSVPLISNHPLYYYPALLFLIGSLFYINKAYIPSCGYLVILLFFVLLLVMHFNDDYKVVAYTLFLSYFVFWCAYNLPFLNGFNRMGDYSYGLYIYAFPIQQLIASQFNQISVNQFFLYSLLATLLLAIPSWHLIEKKAIKYKKVEGALAATESTKN